MHSFVYGLSKNFSLSLKNDSEVRYFKERNGE